MAVGLRDSIFSRIIRGEVPSYKVYEDECVYAFLDINPETPGHVLVVPKVEVDKVYALDDIYYGALWRAVKIIAAHMEEVFGARTLIKVIGTDVPHAHVHLVPFDAEWFHGRVVKMKPEEMEEMRRRLAI
jgi:histidine triad (HIT) family protein